LLISVRLDRAGVARSDARRLDHRMPGYWRLRRGL
jgi:hypothetical protein